MKLTKEEKELTITFLTEIVNGDLSNIENRDLGICNSLQCYLFENTWTKLECGYDIITHFSKLWDKHAGEDDYPIPWDRSEYAPLTPLWEGNQLELRQSLCKHMIKRIQDEVK